MKRRMLLIVVLSLLLAIVENSAVSAEKIQLKIWNNITNIEAELDQRIQQYMAENPNIEIEQITVTTDYWEKLLAAVASRQVPDIVSFHNQRISTFKNALEPWPEEIFPLEKMREEYFAFDASTMIDGKWYFFPIGIMDGLVYYNKAMFKDAGLSEQLDSGTWTWDEARALAKKLTRRDQAGNLQISGLAMKGGGAADPLWADIFYQMGGQWYTEDGKHLLWDTPPGLKATELIWDIINVDKVDAMGFMNWSEAFTTGKAAMVPTRGWFGGNLDRNFPDLDVGVFPNPVPKRDTEVLGRNNYECEFAVMRGANEARKQEAFKFLSWLYGNDDWQVFVNITQNRLPSKISLWDDPRILQDKELKVSRHQAPRTAFIGDMPPNAGWTAIQNLISRLYIGESPTTALSLVAAQADKALQQTPAQWVVEQEWMKTIIRE